MEHDDATYRALIESAVREQTPRLRALARDLTRDGQDADDLVQDTWLAAFEGAHCKRESSLRAWLGGILRNTARQRRRSEERRRRRETMVARREDEAAAPEADWRSLHRIVLELREPYRTTITQRYFHGRTPRQLAQEQGISIRTVTTRTSRALELLRRRLGAGSDGRTSFPGIAALVAWFLARWGRRGQVGVACATVLVLAAGFALFPSGAGRVPSLAVATPVADSARDAAPRFDPRSGSSTWSSARRSLERSSTWGEASTSTVTRLLEGRVLDAFGEARAGAVVAFVPDGIALGAALRDVRVARADGSGRFRMQAASARAGYVVALDHDHVPIVVERVLEQVEREVILVVAPRRELRGRIVNARGAPVAGARVALLRQPRWSTRVDGPRARIPNVTSDTDGEFTLTSAFDLPHAFVRVRHPDHLPAQFALDGRDPGNLELVLEEGVKTEAMLRGVVVDAHGRPARAVVSTGHGYVETGDDGVFALEAPPKGAGELRAAGRGAASPAARIGTSCQNRSFRLQLEHPAHDLDGVVVDYRGRPVAGAKLWILDPTPFGVGRAGAPREPGMPIFLESVLAGLEPGLHVPSVTDASGAFHMEGLTGRAYRLAVLAPDGTLFEPPPLDPGTGSQRLELPERADHAFTGRVVGDHGRPVAGARVTAILARISLPIEWNDWWFRRDLVTVETTTASDGRFVFEGLATEPPLITVTGAHLFPTNRYRSLEASGRFELPLELSVSERARLRVTAREAVSFELLDAAGETLPIDGTNLGLFPVVGPAAHRRDLVAGTTAEWSIPCTAIELVTYAPGGREPDRRPLSIHAGELTVVDL